MNTIEKLNLIAGIESGASQTIRELKDEQREIFEQALAYLPVELLARYNEIDDITDNTRADADKRIADLKDEVKADVLAAGKSVKGAFLEARFVKGRVSWDGKALDAMIAFVPQIATARSEGQPSVSFYEVKK